jgi:hypothetical protein
MTYEELKQELNKMLDTESKYYLNLWNDIKKSKNEITKEELIDIADGYINILNSKIETLEYKED